MISAIVPVLLLLLCVTYYDRAKLNLGYWPTYGNPDPKQLGWWGQHSLIYLFLFLCYPALGWLAFSVTGLSYKRHFRQALLVVVAGLLGFGLISFMSTTYWGDGECNLSSVKVV